MNKKTITLIIFSILLITVLNGCFEENNKKNTQVTTLIGAWSYTHGTQSEFSSDILWETQIYNFYEKNEFAINNVYKQKDKEYNIIYFGTYNITDNKITFCYEVNIEENIKNYSYQIKNNILTLTPIDDLYSEVLNLNRYKETSITYEKITEEKHFLESINLSLPTTDDLPEGYIKCQNSSSFGSEISFNPLEAIITNYNKDNCTNFINTFFIKVIKFKTSNDAHLYYQSQNFYMAIIGGLPEVEGSINTIGDESIAFNHGLAHDSVLHFRIANVVCSVSQEYTFALSISSIVAEKINSYLE